MDKLAVIAVACLATVGCAQPALPTSPTGLALAAGTSQNRIVDEVGVDIPECPECPRTDLVISNQSQRFLVDGFVKRETETAFVAYGIRIQVPETDKFPRVAVLQVMPTKATISVWLSGLQTGYFQAVATAVPSFTTVADTTCASGQRLETRMTVSLQHLGKTSIEERHCTA